MSELIQILIAICPDTATAESKLEIVFKARAEQGVAVIDAAVVRRDERAKLRIHETTDVSGARGATIGAILGGVLSLFAGPGGLVTGAAVGALVGGTTAHVFDTGIPRQRLEEIGAALQPGSAALVTLVEAGYANFLQTLLSAPGIEIVIESMDAEAAQRLEHDHAVARKALALGDALADGGMASAADERPKD